jgi:GNAT superfamily N-acetyltransferase
VTVVSLQPVSEANRAAVLALRVTPEQERFVSDVAGSMTEAADEPDGRAIQWALCAGETPVGFVMVSDDVGGPDYFPQYLWKLLIDHRHQRQGYGTAALDLVADFFRGSGAARVMRTSAGQGDGSPIPFYERYGFVRTGDIVFGDEVLLQYQLR